jgi:hypothetical protein
MKGEVHICLRFFPPRTFGPHTLLTPVQTNKQTIVPQQLLSQKSKCSVSKSYLVIHAVLWGL